MTRALIIVAVTLAGCASFGSSDYTPPYLTHACFSVEWVNTPAQAQLNCGVVGAVACLKYDENYKHNFVIYSREPADFYDYDALVSLGHEVLHRFGAKHK